VRRTPSKRQARVSRLAIGLVIILVGTMALTMAAAISPKLLGQWFTLFEETGPSGTVYKVEARVIGVTPTGVKTATLDVQVRVTNNHAFAVQVTSALFTVVDLQQGRTTLLFSLPASTFPAASVTSVLTTAQVIKVLGVGNKYLVTGTINWLEVYGTTVVGPFFKTFSEIHAVTEFT